MNRMHCCLGIYLTVLSFTTHVKVHADDFRLSLRTIVTTVDGEEEHQLSPANWKPEETAVIICDVWDYHHSINAVRRLEEMLPRMNALTTSARKRGAIIIHAPSDCMPHYETHPARERAKEVPKKNLPKDIASWCSRIGQEEGSASDATYPVDQSDGGEDDDPREHLEWANKLITLGRNPNMPWKAQSPGIDVDAEKDFISDRGDEVWSILQHCNIQQVIMMGVHTNMCVLGRPFGLRQLVKQKMQVALVRDLTDCMYNPASWPFVDHFTGNDLVISHVERYICPTITSNQILEGAPLRFKSDLRTERNVLSVQPQKPNQWAMQTLFADDQKNFIWKPTGVSDDQAWIRCSLRFPDGSLDRPAKLIVSGPVQNAWLNGKSLSRVNSEIVANSRSFAIEQAVTFGNDDANLLVLQFNFSGASDHSLPAPKLETARGIFVLHGKWQVKSGPSTSAHNIPLPAKFGTSPEIFYSLP